MGLRDYESVLKATADPHGPGSEDPRRRGDVRLQVIAVLSLGQSPCRSTSSCSGRGLIKDRGTGNGFTTRWTRTDSPYAGRMLRNLRGWLSDDPVIAKDRERAALARNDRPHRDLRAEDDPPRKEA